MASRWIVLHRLLEGNGGTREPASADRMDRVGWPPEADIQANPDVAHAKSGREPALSWWK